MEDGTSRAQTSVMTSTRLLALLLVFPLASIAACRDAGDSPLVQARTARGVAAGAAARATIGPEGGELVSSDGRLVVRFPAGAASVARDFEILPITNLVPGGTGLAYRLEPSGVAFDPPVELEFHYGDADLEGSAPEALLVATQDDAGAWWLPSRPSVDAEARTVRLAVAHFSDWSLLSGYRLDPTYANVKVGRALALRLISCVRPPSGDYDFVPVYECQEAEEPFDGIERWQVNGIEGGSAEAGTVSATSAVSARFLAPTRPPASNPVAISGELRSVLGRTWVVAHVDVEEGDCGVRGDRTVPCRFEGETTYEANDVLSDRSLRTSATSTWRFDGWDPQDDGVARFVPVAGEVRILEHRYLGCSVADTPATHAIGSAENDTDRTLAIDFTTNPPTMRRLRGTTHFPVTEILSGGTECATPGTLQEDGVFSWVDDGGTTTPLTPQGTLDGSATTDFGSYGSVRSTWHLEAR